MIKVRGLTKYYGATVGARDLNFEVAKGEVLGFLGPNGAGKTTTMKMLTCYLPPSSGTASIFGYDILENSLAARACIGYLPEHNPLYGDMSTYHYLEYIARLKGVHARRIPREVDRVLEQCGLQSVPKRMIQKLSKGYQQRIGIAQALLADPELLILDEPTIGLDPKQIIEIRELIKGLGQDRTIILSSHILPEVSHVCNRIIIINRGELVADDTPDNLRAKLKQASVIHIKLKNTAPSEHARDILSKLEGIQLVTEDHVTDGPRGLTIETPPDRDLRGEIVKTLTAADLPLIEIYQEELTLEDIYLRLITEEAI